MEEAENSNPCFCKIWDFTEAPIEYQELGLGSDESWVLFSSKNFASSCFIDRFIGCDYQGGYEIDGGYVYILSRT